MKISGAVSMAWLLLALLAPLAAGDDPSSGDPGSINATAPSTVLPKVPGDFRIDLILRAPDLEHPSVVTCDDHGNLFVGEDPMDMRGPPTEEFDRVVLLRWDPAGGPPEKTIFCDRLAAVFGLVWLEDWLYVLHAPHYSRFRDTDGDGVAEIREDLADGFGPKAGIFGFNDHIVTGTRLGLDGLIYISVGDKGIQKATGSDGTSITLEGGGVVRMRPDGSRLEVFSSGTRNHLDVAMDHLDNIFTYDNTDDGLGWWTRFTHHIPTGYYGYPYDYLNRRERHLPRISEHGGGSPCGGACYREAAWPERYRNVPFFCEWGKQKVQYFQLKPAGATFAADIVDFVTKEGNEEFRPVDLCFSPDGKHMYLADWNYGGWVKPDVVGRLFRITYVGTEVETVAPPVSDSGSLDEQIRALAHPAHYERLRAQRRLAALGPAAIAPLAEAVVRSADPLARVHSVWAQNLLAERLDGFDPTADWIGLLADPSAVVRAQAARALGLRRIRPAARFLERVLADSDPTVRLHAAVALGRIGEPASSAALFASLDEPDEFARFTKLQAMRALGDWRPALPALRAADPHLRPTLLLAMVGVYDEHAVAVLRQWAWESPEPAERARALELIGELHRRADPYQDGWWGTQPARGKPARPKRHEWAGTNAVLATLDAGLLDPAPSVRLAATRALRTAYPNHSGDRIRALVGADPDGSVRQEAIAGLIEHPDPSVLPTLLSLAADSGSPEPVRSAAIAALAKLSDPAAVTPLSVIATDQATPRAVVMAALDALADLKAEQGRVAIEIRLADPDPELKIRAIEAATRLGGTSSAAKIALLLSDADLAVRRAAAGAMTLLKDPATVPTLIDAAAAADLRFDATLALAAMPDRRALALLLDGLTGKSPELRVACRNALIKIRAEIGSDVVRLAEARELPVSARVELQSVFSAPTPITRWQLAGAWPKADRPAFDPNQEPSAGNDEKGQGPTFSWKQIETSDPGGRVDLANHVQLAENCWALAYAKLEADQPSRVNALVGSDDELIVWVNGEEIYNFGGSRGYRADEATLKLPLRAGSNHVYVLSGNQSGPWSFSVQVGRRDPAYAFLYEDVPAQLDPAAYADFAKSNPGSAERGRELFFDKQGLACVKCHAVGGEGAKVGPDLGGVGGRYPRDELVRSILEPSSRVLSSYQVVVVATTTGDVIQGIEKSATSESLELLTAEGKAVVLATADIDSKTKSAVSLMPNGLKDGMSLADFADIVAYLESLKESTAPPETPTAAASGADPER